MDNFYCSHYWQHLFHKRFGWYRPEMVASTANCQDCSMVAAAIIWPLVSSIYLRNIATINPSWTCYHASKHVHILFPPPIDILKNPPPQLALEKLKSALKPDAPGLITKFESSDAFGLYEVNEPFRDYLITSQLLHPVPPTYRTGLTF